MMANMPSATGNPVRTSAYGYGPRLMYRFRRGIPPWTAAALTISTITGTSQMGPNLRLIHRKHLMPDVRSTHRRNLIGKG